MEGNDCIFCKIARKEVGADIVYEDDNFIAVLDINPEMEGHTLVIPRKHFTTILDTPSSLGNEFLDAIKNVCFELLKKEKAEGFNIVFNVHELAGQVVPHVHAHVLPRKTNDGMKMKMDNGLREKKKNKK